MTKINEFKTPQGVLELHGVRGKVVKEAKRSETSVSGGGGSISTVNGHTSGYVSEVVTTTTVYDDIFIVDETGQEHILKLIDWDFPVRNDHEISAFWVTKNGKRPLKGGYVCVVNHTLSKTYFETEKQLKVLFRNSWAGLFTILSVVLLFVLFRYVNLFSFLFPTKKALETLSFDSSFNEKAYIDSAVDAAKYNETANLNATIFQAIVFVVIAVAIFVVYYVLSNKRMKSEVQHLIYNIQKSSLYKR